MNLQKRWDIYLLTMFFTKPGKWYFKIENDFKKEKKVTDEEFSQLKRRKTIYLTPYLDVYGFVAMHLRPLYRVAINRDVSSVFELAEWLKTHDVDTKAKSKGNAAYEQKAINHNLRRRYRASVHEQILTDELYDSRRSSGQWSKTK